METFLQQFQVSGIESPKPIIAANFSDTGYGDCGDGCGGSGDCSDGCSDGCGHGCDPS